MSTSNDTQVERLEVDQDSLFTTYKKESRNEHTVLNSENMQSPTYPFSTVFIKQEDVEQLVVTIEHGIKKERMDKNTELDSEIDLRPNYDCSTTIIKQEAVDEETDQLGVTGKNIVKVYDVQIEEWGGKTSLHLDKTKDKVVEQVQIKKEELNTGLQQPGVKTVSLKTNNDAQTSSSSKQQCADVGSADTPQLIECVICRAKYKSKSTLMIHMRIHTGEKPYTCDICKRRFRQKQHLKSHIVAHTGDKPYCCTICDRTFLVPSVLKAHMRTHTDDKAHGCHICNKKLTYGYLRRHMRIHTGEKPYRCDICGDTFNNSGGLTRHKQTHARNKPYKCQICNKRFPRTDYLAEHMKIHSSDKPYSCSFCAKRFISSGYLAKHVKTHR